MVCESTGSTYIHAFQYADEWRKLDFGRRHFISLLKRKPRNGILVYAEQSIKASQGTDGEIAKADC